MPSVSVSGVQVNFPFDPYPCQVTYMEKVISCLKEVFHFNFCWLKQLTVKQVLVCLEIFDAVFISVLRALYYHIFSEMTI